MSPEQWKMKTPGIWRGISDSSVQAPSGFYSPASACPATVAPLLQRGFLSPCGNILISIRMYLFFTHLKKQVRAKMQRRMHFARNVSTGDSEGKKKKASEKETSSIHVAFQLLLLLCSWSGGSFPSVSACDLPFSLPSSPLHFSKTAPVKVNRENLLLPGQQRPLL